MQVALIANGIFDFKQRFAKKRKSFSSFIAVDGGIKHCALLGITPHLILGDLDSAPEELLQKFVHVEQRSFPEDKDETDLEIALKEVVRPHLEVTVFGGLGARVDHALANLVLLSRYPGNVSFENDEETIFAIDKRAELDCEKGQRVSLIALNGPACVSSKGLKWELEHRVLGKQFIGISNVALQPKVSLTVHEGDLLCFLGVPS